MCALVFLVVHSNFSVFLQNMQLRTCSFLPSLSVWTRNMSTSFALLMPSCRESSANHSLLIILSSWWNLFLFFVSKGEIQPEVQQQFLLFMIENRSSLAKPRTKISRVTGRTQTVSFLNSHSGLDFHPDKAVDGYAFIYI